MRTSAKPTSPRISSHRTMIFNFWHHPLVVLQDPSRSFSFHLLAWTLGLKQRLLGNGLVYWWNHVVDWQFRCWRWPRDGQMHRRRTVGWSGCTWQRWSPMIQRTLRSVSRGGNLWTTRMAGWQVKNSTLGICYEFAEMTLDSALTWKSGNSHFSHPPCPEYHAVHLCCFNWNNKCP